MNFLVFSRKKLVDSIFPPNFVNSISGLDATEELWALVHEANDRVNVDVAGVGQDRGEAELLQQAGQEEEEFVLGKVLAEAVPLTHQKWDAPLVLPEGAVSVQEALGHEPAGLGPVGRVVHDPPHIGIDGSALGQGETFQLDSLGGGMGRGVDNAGVAQHLVDEGVHVRHPNPVLKAW